MMDMKMPSRRSPLKKSQKVLSVWVFVIDKGGKIALWMTEKRTHEFFSSPFKKVYIHMKANMNLNSTESENVVFGVKNRIVWKKMHICEREKCCTQETFNAKFRCKITFLFPRTLSSIDKAVSHVSCEKGNLFLEAAQSTIKFN